MCWLCSSAERSIEAELKRVLDADVELDTSTFEDDIPNIVRHTPGQTVVLGPDPVAFERRKGG